MTTVTVTIHKQPKANRIMVDCPWQGGYFFAAIDEEPFASMVAADEPDRLGFFPLHQVEIDRDEATRRSSEQNAENWRKADEAAASNAEAVATMNDLAERD